MIFPLEGRGVPVLPGSVIEYTAEDLYGRPWAAIREKYFEQGMQPNEDSEDIFDFE